MRYYSKIALYSWLPVVVWMTAILTLSSIPGQDLPKVDIPNIDKIAHLAEYLILGFLTARAVFGSFRNIGLAKILISAIIIASLCAIFDEWHQQYIPGRVCDINDLLSDLLGSCLGIALYITKGKRWQI